MNARIAAAVMCSALAGCAECRGLSYDLADKSVVSSVAPGQRCYPAGGKYFADETPARTSQERRGASWGIAKLIKAPVEDLKGTKVAEIDDLLISPDGRIKTAVLTVTNSAGETRTITVAFKDLKRTVGPDGEYTIRTTKLSKPDKKASGSTAPEKDGGE